MNTFTIIGLIAAACTTLSFLPQAIKVIKTKNTSDLSLTMYLILTTGLLLWLIYGYLINDIPPYDRQCDHFGFCCYNIIYEN